MILAGSAAWSADKDETKDSAAPAAATATTTATASKLFDDDVLAKGKGVEVHRSQMDESLLQFQANLNARGQKVPEEKRAMIEAQILDRLVITQLLLNRATESDRTRARELADKFMKDTREQAGSAEAFDRQLMAMGFTQKQFEQQITERAISEAVVEREIKDKVKITDEMTKQYYADHPDKFQKPEMVRAAHILLATVDPVTEAQMSDEQKKQKREQIDALLVRARKGEDFAALAKEFSDDPGSKDKGGEYTFPRGRMVPPFETAAFSLKTNEISDVVITQFGYHIIKLYEKIPEQKVALDTVEKDLKDGLAREEVQRQLPDFVERLKKDADIKYFNGGAPPSEPSAGPPTSAPTKPADK